MSWPCAGSSSPIRRLPSFRPNVCGETLATTAGELEGREVELMEQNHHAYSLALAADMDVDRARQAQKAGEQQTRRVAEREVWRSRTRAASGPGGAGRLVLQQIAVHSCAVDLGLQSRALRLERAQRQKRAKPRERATIRLLAALSTGRLERQAGVFLCSAHSADNGSFDHRGREIPRAVDNGESVEARVDHAPHITCARSLELAERFARTTESRRGAGREQGNRSHPTRKSRMTPGPKLFVRSLSKRSR